MRHIHLEFLPGHGGIKNKQQFIFFIELLMMMEMII